MARPEDRDLETTREAGAADDPVPVEVHETHEEHETHASTAGAAAAGAVTGGVIGLTGGPVGAAIGAVGGAIVGVAAERMMHGDDDRDVETVPEARTEADIPATVVDTTAPATITHTSRLDRLDDVERDRDTEPRV